MRLFLGRKGRKLHSLIWVLREEEFQELGAKRKNFLRSSEGISKINSFLSVKDPFSLMKAIESFGRPLCHHELSFDKSYEPDAKRIKREYSPKEYLSSSEFKRLSTGGRSMLASECWFLVPNDPIEQEKVSSARRAIEAYDPFDSDALRKSIEECGDRGHIVVEPLLDWLWMKNLFAMMLSLWSALDEGSSSPLQCAGFKKAMVSKFGSVRAVIGEYEAFVVPLAFNEYWRNRSLVDEIVEAIKWYNPLTRETFLNWAQYSRVGFKSVSNGMHSKTCLVGEMTRPINEIRFVSSNHVEGRPGSITSFKDDWGGNLYLAVIGDLSNEVDVAKAFFQSFGLNRLNCGMESGDLQIVLGREAEDDGGILAKSLEAQLWLTLLSYPGTRVGRCEKCGLPFIARGRAVKQYCSQRCLRSAQ